MKKQSLLFFLLVYLASSSLFAQNILWQESFQDSPFDAIPGESWTTGPTQSPESWSWTPDGTAAGLFWNDRMPIGSESGGGALLFDSDHLLNEAGVLAPHQGITTSPVLNVRTPGGPLFLSFYQYYRSHRSFTSVAVIDPQSNDVFEVFSNELIGTNVETSHKERVVIDLSDLPFTGEQIQLRFTFQGSYYFWLIDDLVLYDAYPYPVTIPSYVGDSLANYGKPYAVNCAGTAIVPNQLVVQFKPGVSEAEKEELREDFGVMDVSGCMCNEIELWQLGNPLPTDPTDPPSGTGRSVGIDELKASASSSSKVDGVDPNFYNWNELQPSSEGPLPPLISTPAVGTSGNETTVIAMLDTGVEVEHPTLNPFIFLEGEEEFQNCLPADTIGWNFVDDNNNSGDSHDHGSHLAGIVVQHMAAAPSPETDYRLLPIKTHDQNGVSDLFDTTCGLYYALQQGAKVINCSWGWLGDSSKVWSNILDSAIVYNSLVVAAAGNDAIWLDTLQQYPACYQRDNLLAVASVDAAGENLSPFSNFSATYIDLAAPGENILSTVRNSGQARKSGTSMSAPAVAAQAGRIYRQGRGEVTFQDVRNCILASALRTQGLSASVQEGRALAPGLGSCDLVGTNDVSIGNLTLKLSPNPAVGLTVLEIGTTLNTPGKVTIFNVGGQQIRETRFSQLPENGKVKLNLRGIPPGLYLLTVSAAQQTGVTKLIIAGD
jgi:hypothetical protein